MKSIANVLIILAVVLYGQTTASGQWFSQYKDLQSISARLDQFTTEYPALVESFVIGQSYEGRDIRGIKISGTGGDRAVRPAVLLNGTQHAREWISPMTNMYAAEQLLAEYDSNGDIQSMLDAVDFYVIPVVNPDGYEYSWTTNRRWRKNRRPISTGVYGVDLNRNWDYGWGLDSGSSSNPGFDTYRGPTPFSEPETQALRDFYYGHQNLVSNIDFHSYSQLILYPYGYSQLDEPADGDLMRQLAMEMSDSMQSVHGTYYEPVSASDLYLASGISIDWTYGDQNVYSYTVELRPQFSFPGFELPEDEILPTAEEAFASVLDLGEFTMALSSGDFNYDGIYDCADLDALYDAVLTGTDKYEFDVDGDGTIGPADLGAWLANAGNAMLDGGGAFLPGDADLDGYVTTSDFNIWNENKFSHPGSWCGGDFNIDGFVDASDFNLWNVHKFQMSGGTVVPEPTLALQFGMVGLGLLLFSRSRHEPGFHANEL